MRLLLYLLLLLAAPALAQSPLGLNYQAVARDGDGDLLASQSIDLTFVIHPSSTTVGYREDHVVTTNEYGLFSVVIGSGTVSGPLTFDEIDWGQRQQLRVTVNGNDLGSIPFQGVPYAMAVVPQEEVVSIPGAAFAPNNNEAAFLNSVGTGGAEITSGAMTAVSVLNAPVQLPHGARVTRLTAYYVDDSTEDLRIWLAKEFFASGFSIPAEVSTSGMEGTTRDVSVDVNHTVNNEDGGYFIRVFCSDWEAEGRKRVKGVKIHYTH